jgi:predicted RNA binding protein YcfA (HicA-like mRNA interferase family)
LVKLPRLTAQEAEKLLLKAGFEMIRSKGSHRIYKRGDKRIVVPFHTDSILHPKIVKKVLKSIEE